MAKLFLEGIFGSDSQSPSSVRIRQAISNGKTGEPTVDLTGLMIGDPTFSAQNKWGPILNDISNLADISSLWGSQSMFSWVNASTMCWKGTSPLMIGIEFYLINYSKNLGLEGNLKQLVKLASLYGDPDAITGKNFKVLVHGGYAASILEGNASFFTDTSTLKVKNAKEFEQNGTKFSELRNLYIDGYAEGSIELIFGKKSRIRNLLLSKISVTESNVEVASQNGSNRKPLYYRVNAQFTGVRPLVSVDVDHMFKFAS